MEKAKIQINHIVMLTSLFIFSYITCAIVQNRMIPFGHNTISMAVFVYPISCLVAGIVTEVYGYRFGRMLLWAGIATWYFFALFVTASVHQPLLHQSLWHRYGLEMDAYFKGAISCVTGGTLAVLVGSFFNIYLMAKTKVWLKGKHIYGRLVFANAVGELLTTVIALLIHYSGKLTLTKMFYLILWEYLILVGFAVVFGFLVVAIVKYLEKQTGLKHFDTNTKFNPFRFFLEN